PLPAQGVSFWTAMYIPVVVAMASQQNVLGAVKGGPMAITAGILATVVCFALIPAIDRIGLSKRQTALSANAGQGK
ncbi:MAG: malonate transporter subunit MadL, partial [Rhodoferax sp.]